MRSELELERTYAPGPDDEMPDLAAADGVASVGETGSVDLVATYYDTEELALTRAGVSLRRRTGDSDAGWHLKVPAGEGRDEIAQPLARATRTVPAALRRAGPGLDHGPAAVARGRDRDAPLDPSAARTADGAVLAEVADDRVVGVPRRDGRRTGHVARVGGRARGR